MDALILRLLVEEVSPRLQGLTVRQVQQPFADVVVLTLRAPGSEHRLGILTDPAGPTLCLDPAPSHGNATLPPFGAYLRKHLVGSILAGFRQEGLDRVTILELVRRRGAGGPLIFRLIAELTGRHANLILVDASEGGIRSVLRPRPTLTSSRSLLPGEAYTPPPRPQSADLLDLSEEECLRAAAMATASADPVQTLMRSASGISPNTARELLHRARCAGGTPEGLAHELCSLVQRVRLGSLTPHLYVLREDPDRVVLAPIELTHLEGFEGLPVTSVVEAARVEWEAHLRRREKKDRQAPLLRALNSRLQRRTRLLRALEEDRKRAEQADLYQQYGRLLLHEKTRVTRGMKFISLSDPADPSAAPVPVPLNPRLGPIENAQAYFKKASKLKRSRAFVEARRNQVQEEIATLEEMRTQAAQAGSAEELHILGQELSSGEARTARGPSRPASRERALPVRRYVAGGRWEVLVGKSAAANDLLVTRLTARGDWWFHARGVPGSHVVVRNPARQERPPPDVVRAAACLAAHHSQLKGEPRVAVSWTLRKYIRKPKGSPKGLVVMDREEVIYVPATREALEALADLVPLARISHQRS